MSLKREIPPISDMDANRGEDKYIRHIPTIAESPIAVGYKLLCDSYFLKSTDKKAPKAV
jgi:hypothetical protein